MTVRVLRMRQRRWRKRRSRRGRRRSGRRWRSGMGRWSGQRIEEEEVDADEEEKRKGREHQDGHRGRDQGASR